MDKELKEKLKKAVATFTTRNGLKRLQMKDSMTSLGFSMNHCKEVKRIST